MINTSLHNELIDREIDKRCVQADIFIQKEKNRLMRERLKSYGYLVGFVFVVLLLLVLLLWLLPNFSGSSSNNNECGKENITQTKRIEIPKKELLMPTPANQKEHNTQENGTFKDGVEYVKKDNYVYRREWKEGRMIVETQLEPTIDASREQRDEKIPQISKPQFGKEK